MIYKKTAKWLFLMSVLLLIILNIIHFNPFFRMFIGSFGFGGAIVLWVIGNAIHDDE